MWPTSIASILCRTCEPLRSSFWFEGKKDTESIKDACLAGWIGLQLCHGQRVIVSTDYYYTGMSLSVITSLTLARRGPTSPPLLLGSAPSSNTAESVVTKQGLIYVSLVLALPTHLEQPGRYLFVPPEHARPDIRAARTQ
jgi:hypothetical protein